MRELLREYRSAFRVAFRENDKFENAEIKFSGSVSEDILQKGNQMSLDKNLIDFYKVTDGFEASWDYDLSKNLLGRMNIVDIDSVLSYPWEEELYVQGEDDIKLKNFKPLDIFMPEACCGIVLDGTGDQCIYFHDFGEDTLESMDIDFKGYFELAIDAKIMTYWQRYLVYLVNGEQNIEISFPRRMKELFPDFDIEAFTTKFESLRLSKK